MKTLSAVKSRVQSKHDLAIDAIERCVIDLSYGSYQKAVEDMLPVYKAAPELLDALESNHSLLYRLYEFEPIADIRKALADRMDKNTALIANLKGEKVS